MSTIRPEDHPALPVLILAAVFLAFALAQDTRPISFFHPPAIVTDTAMVVYEVRIPINSRNRFAAIAAFEGDVMVQYTEIPLAGETRRTLWDKAKFRLPEGEIQLIAALYGIRDNGEPGELARDTHAVRVLGRGF